MLFVFYLPPKTTYALPIPTGTVATDTPNCDRNCVIGLIKLSIFMALGLPPNLPLPNSGKRTCSYDRRLRVLPFWVKAPLTQCSFIQ